MLKGSILLCCLLKRCVEFFLKEKVQFFPKSCTLSNNIHCCQILSFAIFPYDIRIRLLVLVTMKCPVSNFISFDSKHFFNFYSFLNSV